MTRRARREKKSRFFGTKQLLTTLNQPAHAVVHDLDPSDTPPTGMVSPYAGTTAPSGWLLCDGSAVSRTVYARLFAVTSTNFGVGDGSTTFNVPDLRSRFPVGVGTYAALGNDEGNAEAARTTAHTHGAGTLDTDDHNIANNTENTGGQDRATNGGHNITGDTGSALGVGDMPHVALNFIIHT